VEEAIAAVSGRQGGDSPQGADAAAVGGNSHPRRRGEADGRRVGLRGKWKGVTPNGWGGFGRPARRCQRASWGAKRRRPPAARAPHPRKWVHLAPRCLKKSVASPVRGLDDWLPLALDLVVRGRRSWSRRSRRRVPTIMVGRVVHDGPHGATSTRALSPTSDGEEAWQKRGRSNTRVNAHCRQASRGRCTVPRSPRRHQLDQLSLA